MDIGIGVSSLPNPSEAVLQALSQAAIQIETQPKAIFLFTTIHYKENNGFSKCIQQVYEQYPKIKLVGGTIAGFMAKEGVFVRGVAVFAVGGNDVDVSVGVGRNTKLKPKNAGIECARMIKTGLSQSIYQNKYFFTLISSATVPNLPIINKQRVIEGFPFIDVAVGLFDFISNYIQFGAGKDESVMASLSSELNEYMGIGGASSDDLKLEENFQFCMKEIYTNSVVGLGISTQTNGEVNTSFGLKPTGKKLNITKTTSSKYIVKEINNKDAVDSYLSIMGWDRKVLDDRLYRKVFYFPIVESGKSEDEIEPRMFGLVYGSNFVFPMKANDGNLEIFQSSGTDIMNSSARVIDGNRKTGIIVSCATRLETLGGKTYKIKENIYDRKLDKYLLIYTAGEYSKKKDANARCFYQSDNALLFD